MTLKELRDRLNGYERPYVMTNAHSAHIKNLTHGKAVRQHVEKNEIEQIRHKYGDLVAKNMKKYASERG